MAENKPEDGKEIAVKQRQSEVGYKRPPKEHQFKPGQSGNPKGPPVHRTHLWLWLCKYMALTDVELEKVEAKELTQAQQTALKLVKNMKDGKDSGSERLARHIFDREQGRAVERLVIETEDALTDGECEEIRGVLLKNHADR
jgi:hypothetical protein